MAQVPIFEPGPGGALRIELPPSRLAMRVGLVFEVAFTGFATLALFAPAGDAPAGLVVLAWAAAFTVIELMRFGRPELGWDPRQRRLTRRVLMKRGALPLSTRQWRLGAAARFRVEAHDGFWHVVLDDAGTARPGRLLWAPDRGAAEQIAARLAEAITAPR